MTTDLLIQAGYALAIGLVIGLEREHHFVAQDLRANESPEESGLVRRSPALGVRTFALISLLGWTAGLLGRGWPWLPPLGFLAVGGLLAVQYVIVRDEGNGLTSETAALLTFVLGVLINVERALAVALALATTLLLIAKPWVHSVVGKLRRIELSGTLQLFILLAIVLPLLPDEPLDPWGALPPLKIGWFVVLIGGISYVGYVLSRLLGERRGAGLTGIVGGLTSSTAVTIAMAKASRNPGMREPAQMAIFLANAMMFGRVIVIAAVISRAVASRLVIPMSAMGLVMLLGGLWKWRAATAGDTSGDADIRDSTRLQNPFALLPALKWGVILSAVLLLAAVAQEQLGELGLYAAAAFSGIADVDAISIAVSEQVGDGLLAAHVATLGITIAVICNTVIKGVIAMVSGGRSFGWHIALVFLAAIAAGGASALLLRL